MKNLVLIDENSNLVVESLNGQFEFVHNKEDGSNWFNQKTLAKMFGVSQVNISNRLKPYIKNVKENKGFITNSYKPEIRLKTNLTSQKVKFYNFKAVTYLAYRINTPEALNMLDWIDSSLNTMFNVAVGKESINSNKDWLKSQCEVKQLQASTCRDSAKNLYGCGLKSDADKIWSKHKKLEAEALKFKEMFLDYERLDREVATVRNVKSEQLKLI